MATRPSRLASGAHSSRRWLPALCTAVILAAPAQADVMVKQKTVSEGLSGFGDGTSTSTLIIAGDKSRAEDEYTYTGRFKTFVGKKPKLRSTITRLDKELVWSLEPDKKQYREMTFAQMREAMEKGMADAEAQASQSQAKAQDADFKFDVDVKKTGAKQDINGFACEQVVITATGKPEKPEKGAENAEIKLIMDQWMTSAAPGQEQIAAFYKTFAAKLDLDATMSRINPMARQMYGNGMKHLADKLKDVKGYAIRSTFSIEGPEPNAEQKAQMSQSKAESDQARAEAKEQQAKQEKEQDAADVKGSVGGMVGRKLGGMFAKKSEEKASKSAEDGRSGGSLFKVVTEVTGISTSEAPAGSFDLPSGYKKVEGK